MNHDTIEENLKRQIAVTKQSILLPTLLVLSNEPLPPPPIPLPHKLQMQHMMAAVSQQPHKLALPKPQQKIIAMPSSLPPSRQK